VFTTFAFDRAVRARQTDAGSFGCHTRRSINGKAPNITMAIKGTHTGAAAADSEFLVAQASGPVILKHRV